jgi:hypothetical protein
MISAPSYLYCGDLDSSGVPSFPFPPLGTHCPQTQERYRPVSFTQLDAVSNLSRRVNITCQNPQVPR